jgi:hypothetical protein
MLLGGLWHGASFRFVLWGGMHGVVLAIHKFFMETPLTSRLKANSYYKSITPVAGTLLTFHFVCFCWIFFRASSMELAGQMISQILFHFSPQVLFEFVRGYWTVLAFITLGYVLHFLPHSVDQAAERWTTQLPLAGKAFMLLAIIIICIQTKSASIQPFIYFQF